MRIIIALVLFSWLMPCKAQSPFKYQIRLNVINLPDFYYAGATRFGIETLHRKYNWGADYLAFNMSNETRTIYSKDSFYRRRLDKQLEWIGGLGINVMRTFSLKNNCNQLVVGVQGFVGMQIQTNEIYEGYLDTSPYSNPLRYTPPTYAWQGNNAYNPRIENHGSKLVLGITPFVRFQLFLSKRFTINPELMLPVYFRNQIGGDIRAEFTPGFNFCVGYRLKKRDK
ncbi:MAG: hypothetical protein V4613_04515 [Bacteroidota bacterium]